MAAVGGAGRGVIKKKDITILGVNLVFGKR